LGWWNLVVFVPKVFRHKNIKWTWKHHLKEMGDIEKGTYNKMKQQFLPNNLPKTFLVGGFNPFEKY